MCQTIAQSGLCRLWRMHACECMEQRAVLFVNGQGDIAADSGRTPQGAYVRWAMQPVSVSVLVSVSVSVLVSVLRCTT